MNGFMDGLMFWTNVINVPLAPVLTFFAYWCVRQIVQDVKAKKTLHENAGLFTLVVIMMAGMSLVDVIQFLGEQLL